MAAALVVEDPPAVRTGFQPEKVPSFVRSLPRQPGPGQRSPPPAAGSYRTEAPPSHDHAGHQRVPRSHPLSTSDQPSGAPSAPRRSPVASSGVPHRPPGQATIPGTSAPKPGSSSSPGNSSAGSPAPSAILQVFKNRRTNSRSPGAGVFQLARLSHCSRPFVYHLSQKTVAQIVSFSLPLFVCKRLADRTGPRVGRFDWWEG